MLRQPAPVQIPDVDAREIRHATALVSFVRGAQLMALAYADYGVITCSEAMFRAAHDTSAESERGAVAASAPASYVAQPGDMAVTVQGAAYAIERRPGRGVRVLGDTVTPFGGRVSRHVLELTVPVAPAAGLYPEQREVAARALRSGIERLWGSLEAHGGGHAYVLRRAYVARSPDPHLAHDLLLDDDARPCRLMYGQATRRQTRAVLAAQYLALSGDPVISGRMYL